MPDPTSSPGKLTRKQKKKQRASTAKSPSSKTKPSTTKDLQAQIQDLIEKPQDRDESEDQLSEPPASTKSKKIDSTPKSYQDIDALHLNVTLFWGDADATEDDEALTLKELLKKNRRRRRRQWRKIIKLSENKHSADKSKLKSLVDIHRED